MFEGTTEQGGAPLDAMVVENGAVEAIEVV
jgi:hypothetical protein